MIRNDGPGPYFFVGGDHDNSCCTRSEIELNKQYLLIHAGACSHYSYRYRYTTVTGGFGIPVTARSFARLHQQCVQVRISMYAPAIHPLTFSSSQLDLRSACRHLPTLTPGVFAEGGA